MSVTTTTNPNEGDVQTAHKVLVGILVMIVVLVILVEVAGTNHSWAVVAMLVLMGPLLLEGMNHSQQLAAWVSNQPYNPNS
jgi:hypothetical protein